MCVCVCVCVCVWTSIGQVGWWGQQQGRVLGASRQAHLFLVVVAVCAVNVPVPDTESGGHGGAHFTRVALPGAQANLRGATGAKAMGAGE